MHGSEGFKNDKTTWKYFLSYAQTLFELHLNRQPDSKHSNVKLGVAKDNVKIPESVLKVYDK